MSDHFHLLTSLSFQRFVAKRAPYKAILSDRGNKRFVLVVSRDEPQQADGRLGKALQHVSQYWDSENPFGWAQGEDPAYKVLALEVPWSAVVGIDYRYPLHDDGKLVLEATQVVKRVFKTVEEVRGFYTTRPSADVRRGAFSAAPTPQKRSLEGRLPGTASKIATGEGLVASTSGVLGNRQASCSGIRASSSGSAGWRMSGGHPSEGCCAAFDKVPLPGGADAGRPRSSSCARLEVGRRRDSLSVEPVSGGLHRGLHPRRCPLHPELMSGSVSNGAAGLPWRCATGVGAMKDVAAPVTDPGCVTGRGGGLGAPVQRQLRMPLLELGAERNGSPPPSKASHGLLTATMSRLRMLEGLSPRRVRSASDLHGAETAQAGGRRGVASGDLTSNSNYRSSGGGDNSSGCNAASSGDEHMRKVPTASAGGGSVGGQATSAVVNGQRRRCGIDSIRSLLGAGACPCGADLPCRVAPCIQRPSVRALSAGSDAGGVSSRRSDSSGAGLATRFGGAASGTCSGDGESALARGVPPASRWTAPSATYRAVTLVLSFRDPFLPQELRRFVKSDMRLLKLYESGLPAWAVVLPCYGLWYRPWMRRLTWLLFLLISVVSMAAGFYDLYKNVPFLKQVLTSVASRLYLPAAELFEWLERHTQVRLSILLTYLFSKSPLFVSFMRLLRSLAALANQLLQPLLAGLSTMLQPVMAAAQAAATGVGAGLLAAGSALWQAAAPGVAAATAVGQELAGFAVTVLGPPVKGIWGLAVLVAQLIRLAAALLGMVLMGPVQLACNVSAAVAWAGTLAVEQLSAAAAAVAWSLRWVFTLGRAARQMAPAVRAGARAAAAAAQATGAAAGAVGSAAAGGGASGLSSGMALWQWLGLEVVGAYNAVRLTFLQALKSARAVLNFMTTVAQTAIQHRVSLLLQLRRFITVQRRRLPPGVAANVPIPAFASMPSFDASSTPLPGFTPLPASAIPGSHIAVGRSRLHDSDQDLDQSAVTPTLQARRQDLYGTSFPALRLDLSGVGIAEEELGELDEEDEDEEDDDGAMAKDLAWRATSIAPQAAQFGRGGVEHSGLRRRAVATGSAAGNGAPRANSGFPGFSRDAPAGSPAMYGGMGDVLFSVQEDYAGEQPTPPALSRPGAAAAAAGAGPKVRSTGTDVERSRGRGVSRLRNNGQGACSSSAPAGTGGSMGDSQGGGDTSTSVPRLQPHPAARFSSPSQTSRSSRPQPEACTERHQQPPHILSRKQRRRLQQQALQEQGVQER